MIISVLIDSREPPDIKNIDFGAPAFVTALEAGDIMVTCDDGKTLVVERKTPSDLLSSIADNRLFNQCAEMRKLSEFCYVAIIGRMDMVKGDFVRVDGYRITGWNWASLQGALLTVQELGVGVIYGSDYKAVVEQLAQRGRDGVTVSPRRASEPMEPDEAFLASLPDIGAITAKKILGYGPACWGLHWLSNIWDNTLKFPGVTPERKENIRRIIGLKENEYLTVRIWQGEKDGE
jgi:ERCC4-type nuclease